MTVVGMAGPGMTVTGHSGGMRCSMKGYWIVGKGLWLMKELLDCQGGEEQVFLHFVDDSGDGDL